MSKQIERGWVDKVLSSSAFQDYEGRSLEDLREKGIETQFVAQYFQDNGTKCSNYVRGDYGHVIPVIPHEGDRLLHVHYHPSFNVKPSRPDIYGEGRDAALLEEDVTVPPVYLIGASQNDSIFYSARQRKDFPGRFEKLLLGHRKMRTLQESNPLERYNRYEREWQKNLHEKLVESVGKEKERRLVGKPFKEVIDMIGGEREISKIYMKSLENTMDHKTGIFETSGKDHRWLYGNANIFD